jgi:hypothetical protein
VSAAGGAYLAGLHFVNLAAAWIRSTLVFAGSPDRPRPSLSFIFPNRMYRFFAFDAHGQSSKFDGYGFRKAMNDIGWAYRNQAIELIAICRLFSQAAEQVVTQDAEFSK